LAEHMYVIVYDFLGGGYKPKRRKFSYEIDKLLSNNPDLRRVQRSVLEASSRNVATQAKELVEEHDGNCKVYEVRKEDPLD